MAKPQQIRKKKQKSNKPKKPSLFIVKPIRVIKPVWKKPEKKTKKKTIGQEMLAVFPNVDEAVLVKFYIKEHDIVAMLRSHLDDTTKAHTDWFCWAVKKIKADGGAGVLIEKMRAGMTAYQAIMDGSWCDGSGQDYRNIEWRCQACKGKGTGV
jgi:hypothetical protein